VLEDKYISEFCSSYCQLRTTLIATSSLEEQLFSASNIILVMCRSRLLYLGVSAEDHSPKGTLMSSLILLHCVHNSSRQFSVAAKSTVHSCLGLLGALVEFKPIIMDSLTFSCLFVVGWHGCVPKKEAFTFFF